MKIIAIGDIHGRDLWKYITLNETFDKLVFIGDYFHSYNIDGEAQIQNFKDILQYKKDNPEKVVLLFGNHEYHYLRAVKETYGGYQIPRALYIQELLEDAIKNDLIQMCFAHGKYIFTHAGITKTWCASHDIDLNQDVEQSINDLFKWKTVPAFRSTGLDKYGDDITQSPIWVRPNSLLRDHIEGYTHVVGHTEYTSIIFAGKSAIFIDCLGTSREYLVIEDEKVTTGKII